MKLLISTYHSALHVTGVHGISEFYLIYISAYNIHIKYKQPPQDTSHLHLFLISLLQTLEQEGCSRIHLAAKFQLQRININATSGQPTLPSALTYIGFLMKTKMYFRNHADFCVLPVLNGAIRMVLYTKKK